MGMKRTTVFLLILIGVLVVLNVLLLATIWNRQLSVQPIPDRPVERNGRVHHLLKQELGWNDEQLWQFDQERRRLREQTLPVLEEIHRLKREMFDASMGSSPDMDRINKLAADIGEKQALMEQYTAQHVVSLRAICTDDQREKLANFLQELLQMGRPEGMERPVRPRPEGRRQPPPRRQ